MHKILLAVVAAGLIFGTAGCYTRHKVELEPIEIKPMHITVDINLRVDKALDDFFGDIDNSE